MKLLRIAMLGLSAAVAVAGLSLCLANTTVESKRANAPIQTKHKSIDFNRDVRPILSQHCWPCHGPDKEQLKKTGNVSLDSFAGATTAHNGKKPLVPGNIKDSVLWQRINDPDKEYRMPPESQMVKPLSKAEIETIKKWIEEGGDFKQHWAYAAPKMPAVPKVSDPNWCRNGIDRFVLATLDEKGLKPEKEADKETLIRRATLTLTGLQPTPGEVDAFLADKSKDAYEKLVDRLLANPHYGEHQARYWLDAVRYADTHGLHIDNFRAIYPYRDWVIRAFNEDLPFDKFTVYQLAGDLLPNPTLDQKIATAYVRMNPTTNEGGAIEEEFQVKNTFDRVDTTSTVFLGQTIACAKCHDHKYDPFTQKDYYSMFAFFNSTKDAPLDGNLNVPAPAIKAPSPEQEAKMSDLQHRLTQMENQVDMNAAKSWATQVSSQAPVLGKYEASGPYPAANFDEAFDKEFAPEKKDDKTAAWRPIQLNNGQASAFIGKDNASGYLRTTVTVQTATTVELRLGSDDGIKVWVNGQLVHSNKIARALAPNSDKVSVKVNAGSNDILIKVANGGGQDGVALAAGDAVADRALKLTSILKKPSFTDAETKQVTSAFLEVGPESPASKQYRDVLKSVQTLDTAIPMCLVAEEIPAGRPAYVLKRGAYDQRGQRVLRAVPAVFGKLPSYSPYNRLGLAQWMIQKDNPLVSRVFVNRLWQQHFGVGIVRSGEDFGSRGELPSHPELLDYLACKLMDDGWSIKKINRLIVTSAAFRQMSSTDSKKRAADPDNRLISRGPRFRLDAEVIRDEALHASGLLVDRMGGMGVKPYQPAGLWEAVAYPISDTAKYTQDHGDSLYRRSMYLFWKRTSPPPTMILFDAPMREACTVTRSRTNTPLQALAAMNDPGFVEASRVLAELTLSERTSDESRARLAFRLATGRIPSSKEITIILSALSSQRQSFLVAQLDAEKLLKVGEKTRNSAVNTVELASWTMVCNMILNLDEVVTQH